METCMLYNMATLTSHQNQFNTIYLFLQYDLPDEQPPPSRAFLGWLSGGLVYEHVEAITKHLYPYQISIGCWIASLDDVNY